MAKWTKAEHDRRAEKGRSYKNFAGLGAVTGAGLGSAISATGSGQPSAHKVTGKVVEKRGLMNRLGRGAKHWGKTMGKGALIGAGVGLAGGALYKGYKHLTKKGSAFTKGFED